MFNDGLFDDEFNQPLPKVETKLPQNYAKDLQQHLLSLNIFNGLRLIFKAVGHKKTLSLY
jgi:hypothetical protein